MKYKYFKKSKNGFRYKMLLITFYKSDNIYQKSILGNYKIEQNIITIYIYIWK